MRSWPDFRLSQFVRHTLVQNVASLFGVQVANYAVPLVTVPYLARVLGAAGWGMVAFALAFGSGMALVGEYGFALSATREVARHRGDREKLTDLLAGVMGAKTVLGTASLAVAVAARWLVPIFREHPALLWTGMFYALARAFSMMWFFQGIERMRLAAGLEISGQALATIGILVLVRKPEDGWLAVALQGFGYFLSFAVTLPLAYRTMPFRIPSWSSVWDVLHMGWTMFLFRSSVSLYTVGNAFILGLFVSPQSVGYYSGAEKISRAFLGLLSPVSQTLYPRLSHLVRHSLDRAARLARMGVGIMGVGGVAMGALMFLLAPQLVPIVLGKGFEPAIPVVRILALLPPLIALSNVFGIQWMLPLGMDRAFNTIVVLAGLINLGLAVFLAPLSRERGMAWAVVCAETFVTACIYVVLRTRRLDPWRQSAKALVEIDRCEDAGSS
jgi:PST family polysaccharide transporter